MRDKSAVRPVGRPRAGGAPAIERKQVLLTAGQLMTEHGYAATSLRMIAETLGTSAPAIAQRFGTKAQLLIELVGMMSDVSIRFHSALETLHLPPHVRLYKMVHAEVMALAGASHAPVSVFYLPELRRPEFDRAQVARSNMMQFYQDVISEGADADLFQVDSTIVAVEQVFQLTETVIVARDRSTLGTSEALATQTARFVLRGLLTNPSDLDAIQRRSDAINLTMV